jgi:hypothetical protein
VRGARAQTRSESTGSRSIFDSWGCDQSKASLSARRLCRAPLLTAYEARWLIAISARGAVAVAERALGVAVAVAERALGGAVAVTRAVVPHRAYPAREARLPT